MEGIFYLILFVVIVYVVIVYVIPFCLAVGGIAAMVIAAIAFLVGLYHAIKNYFSAFHNNVNIRQWDWEKDDEPARRSYFFGPGYAQLIGTIKEAFELNARSGAAIKVVADIITGEGLGWWGMIRTLGGILYSVVAFLCIYVIGTALCLIVALVHGSITTIVMILTYIVFTIVWLIDRIYLLKNKIKSDCPVCHSRFLIPTFMCPQCGQMHKKLVPGPYGIWKHRCNCGYKVQSTFMNGRSKLEACCPDCGASLVASDARPVVFQLIGGSKAGKTIYLSAFFHEYLQKLSANRNLEVTMTDEYKPYFEELEEWYQGADCPSTTQLNSQMYPLLIDNPLGVKRQFSIYDIAGEMFDGLTADSVLQQQQFHYCNGLLFLIDPFSSGKLREDKIDAGEDVSDFSEMAVEDVAVNFINYLIRTGHAKANARCNIPIAVLIAKSDIREVKRAIGPAKLNSIYRKNEGNYSSYEEVRDGECRQFLIDIGLSAAVENLETQFSNLHYFPVSAMGHSPDGTPYEPWGIMEAIEWMLPLADKELSDLIALPAAANG